MYPRVQAYDARPVKFLSIECQPCWFSYHDQLGLFVYVAQMFAASSGVYAPSLGRHFDACHNLFLKAPHSYWKFWIEPSLNNWTRRWAGKERYKKSQAVWILLSSCSRSRPKHTLAPSYYLAKNRLWPAGPTCSSLLLFAFFSAPRASRVHCQHLRLTNTKHGGANGALSICLVILEFFIHPRDDGAWALLRPLRYYLFLGKTLVWNCCDFATIVVYVARHSLLRRNSFI